jgi:hypothetical protein
VNCTARAPRLGALALGVLLLGGCPITPEVGTTAGGPGGGPGGAEGAPAGGPGGGPGGGGPGGGGPAAFELKLDKMKPQRTQDEIRAGEHVTVEGTVEGTCEGNLRIDLINRDRSATPGGPLSVASPPAPGPFSVVAPKGVQLALGALCDADKDGVVKGGTDDQASAGVDLGLVEDDVDGVMLVLQAAGPSGPGPGGGEGPGGPPPEGGGQPGGPPPEGGGQPGGPPPDGQGGPPPGGQGGPPPDGAGGPPPGGQGGPPPGGQGGPPPGGQGGPPPGGQGGPPPDGAGGPPPGAP